MAIDTAPEHRDSAAAELTDRIDILIDESVALLDDGRTREAADRLDEVAGLVIAAETVTDLGPQREAVHHLAECAGNDSVAKRLEPRPRFV